MPDFFKVLRAEPPAADPWAILSRLVTAFLGLVAVVTEVIGDHGTRAFSLVGALFRIRFRAVVRGPRGTTFVIFAFVAGFPKRLLAI